MSSLVMGIDIGTTAIKVIVVDALSLDRMDIVAVDSIPHDLVSLHPGWAEEDALVWRDHLYEILSRMASSVDLSSLKAIGLTGMVPALVCLDSNCVPIRNSIQQNDMRTGLELKELSSALEGPESVFGNGFGSGFGCGFCAGSYFQTTGSHVNSQHIAPRLMWLRRNEPYVFSRISWIMGSYDYAAYLLTGAMHIESNWALESGLFSLDGALLEPVLGYTGLPASVLPPVIESHGLCGVVEESVSLLTGIPAGVPVYAGTSDHVASAFCTGAHENGDLVLKLGGAGDILLSLDHLAIDDRLFIDYFVSSSCPFIINGCTAASGSLIKWFKNEFGGDFKDLDEQASLVPAGSDGLVMLPYVLGEKTPIFDPNARGVLFGLMLSHTKAHVYRAMLESVAHAFRHHVDVFRELGVEINNVYITNGGSTSPLWRQIMADVLGMRVDYIKSNPGSCLGAAFIAGIAHGLWSEDVIGCFTSQRIPSYPNPDATRAYDRGYSIYRELYPRLKDLFVASISNC